MKPRWLIQDAVHPRLEMLQVTLHVHFICCIKCDNNIVKRTFEMEGTNQKMPMSTPFMPQTEVEGVDTPDQVLYFSYNQDNSCIAVGTRRGYRIY